MLERQEEATDRQKISVSHNELFFIIIIIYFYPLR